MGFKAELLSMEPPGKSMPSITQLIALESLLLLGSLISKEWQKKGTFWDIYIRISLISMGPLRNLMGPLKIKINLVQKFIFRLFFIYQTYDYLCWSLILCCPYALYRVITGQKYHALSINMILSLVSEMVDSQLVCIHMVVSVQEN